MISIISIHIPKTGGTSFYKTLKRIYGEKVSVSYKRKHIKQNLTKEGNFIYKDQNILVLHGHIYYKEVSHIHQKDDAKLICWLRDPIARVVSNYLFFKSRLESPEMNPGVYKLNQHRINESLLEYASLPENQNRMSSFLSGIELEDLFFIGILENYQKDLLRLGQLLKWESPDLFHINKSPSKPPKISEKEVSLLKEWNKEDIQLYQKALSINGKTQS